ncbi:stathmin-4 isoform X2 [Myiozetetes cayanensis]|uniref:stathmin-4 isoform X2 n=1 Tax=Myiozetetes cayanensis TaxID=478635 RepID=UPI00215E5AB4|nr:stathmin-4 isoform X2 [Myiozetetes cayanensis]
MSFPLPDSPALREVNFLVSFPLPDSPALREVFFWCPFPSPGAEGRSLEVNRIGLSELREVNFLCVLSPPRRLPRHRKGRVGSGRSSSAFCVRGGDGGDGARPPVTFRGGGREDGWMDGRTDGRRGEGRGGNGGPDLGSPPPVGGSPVSGRVSRSRVAGGGGGRGGKNPGEGRGGLGMCVCVCGRRWERAGQVRNPLWNLLLHPSPRSRLESGSPTPIFYLPSEHHFGKGWGRIRIPPPLEWLWLQRCFLFPWNHPRSFPRKALVTSQKKVVGFGVFSFCKKPPFPQKNPTHPCGDSWMKSHFPAVEQPPWVGFSMGMSWSGRRKRGMWGMEWRGGNKREGGGGKEGCGEWNGRGGNKREGGGGGGARGGVGGSAPPEETIPGGNPLGKPAGLLGALAELLFFRDSREQRAWWGFFSCREGRECRVLSRFSSPTIPAPLPPGFVARNSRAPGRIPRESRASLRLCPRGSRGIPEKRGRSSRGTSLSLFCTRRCK